MCLIFMWFVMLIFNNIRSQNKIEKISYFQQHLLWHIFLIRFFYNYISLESFFLEFLVVNVKVYQKPFAEFLE